MDVFQFYLLIINAAGFILMLVDKIKAIDHRWRIPERTLLGVALIGGSLGVAVGMFLFRHKTLHIKFALGVPCMLLVHYLIFKILQEYIAK